MLDFCPLCAARYQDIKAVVFIPCNESHRHTEIDFRNGDKNRGFCLTDHLVNSEVPFIMSYKAISKNGCQILTDCNQHIARDISGNHIFNSLVTGKDVLAVSTVPGLELGITESMPS